MFDDVLGAIRDGGLLAAPLAFAAGVVAGLNPCCVSLAPTAAGCCGALRQEDIKKNAMVASAFVLGGALVTMALGLIVAGIGRTAAASLNHVFGYVAAAVPLAFGAALLSGIRLPLPTKSSVVVQRAGVLGVFATGALTSLALTPCSTPVLAALLAVVATDAHPVRGAVLLFAYGLGLGLPVGVLATTSSTLLTRLSSGVVGKFVNPILGVTLVALGLYLLWRA